MITISSRLSGTHLRRAIHSNVCGLATLTGCGSCTDLGTRPGDYTIKIVATSTAADSNAAITNIVLHVTVPHA